MNLNNNK